MTDHSAPDTEPADLSTALTELRHARAEVARLQPFVETADQAQRGAEHWERAADKIGRLYAAAEYQRDEARAERDGAYRERAHLLAHFAALYPSHIGPTDPQAPEWPVLTVETPAGQMSWHIAERDLDLFEHVQPTGPEHRGWDGHTTEEKYERLRRLTASPGSAEDAIVRVRALADEYASSDARWRPLARETAKVLHAALDEPAPGPAATQAAEAETCGHTIDGGFGRPLGPCLRTPGHRELFHRDANGAEWRPRTRIARLLDAVTHSGPGYDTAHRHCILCSGTVQPGPTCDPAGLRNVYGHLVQSAEEKNERAEQIAATLRDVLDRFGSAFPSMDEPMRQQATVPIEDYDRWTAILNPKEQPDGHIYLSTGCLHDQHTYCQSMTGLNGAKRPGECKFCGAKCFCPCHTATKEN